MDAELCGESKCAAYRDGLEVRVQDLETKNHEFRKALTEMCEALENCDRHVGLLGGERCKLERAQKLLGRIAKQESVG